MKFGKYFEPMLLVESDKPFDDSNYIYEIKFDGIRATIHISKNFCKIYTRNGIDVTHLYPELESIQKIVKKDTVFDGEIVSFDKDAPSFSKLQKRSHIKDVKKIEYYSINEPVCFVVFDCLYLEKDLTDLPLIERKRILEKFPDNDFFVKTQYIFKDGKKLFSKIQKLHLEGIVAKLTDSKYQIGTRSKDWIKIKNFKDEVFYVGGYVFRSTKISLLLGEYRDNKFYNVGKASIMKNSDFAKKVLKCKKINSNPFVNFDEKEAVYLEPNLKCEITYIERTPNNSLRQPVFKREYLDKNGV